MAVFWRFSAFFCPQNGQGGRFFHSVASRREKAKPAPLLRRFAPGTEKAMRLHLFFVYPQMFFSRTKCWKTLTRYGRYETSSLTPMSSKQTNKSQVKTRQTKIGYYIRTSTPDMPYLYPCGGTFAICKRAPNIPREVSIIRRTSVLNDRCSHTCNNIGSTKPCFFSLPTIYNKEQALTPDKTMNTQQYKRQYRQLDDETKQKISMSSRNKPKSEIHKQHISQGMEKYWQSVPDRPDLNNDVQP